MLIDLSYRIDPNIKTYPSDGPTHLFQDRFLEKDKYNGYRLETGLHAGTHIDAPMHLTNDLKCIGEFPLEMFHGPGRLLDVRDERAIHVKPEYDKVIKENDIVFLFTGHGQTWGTTSYFQDHPVIADDLCRFFIDKKIKMVGMDLPSPDNYPFEVHNSLFEAGILIIENIANLSRLPRGRDFEVFAFPLKMMAEASPVRVVAKMM